MANKQGTSWTDEALLILRFALGFIFVMHGAQKVLGAFGGHGLEATVKSFQKLYIPPVLGYIACFTEFLGGMALILGIFTRPAALGMAVIMTVAMWKVHAQNGFFINWLCKSGEGHGIEYNLALLAMALAVLMMGPGQYSLSRKLGKS